MIELSLILPVHNEAFGIVKIVRDIKRSLKNLSFKFEIICVENGSTDNTLNILKTMQKKDKSLKIYKTKKGWGNAVRKGIEESKGNYVCYMVSDGQIDPKLIPIIYHEIKDEKYDLVKVTRVKRENTVRFINSKIYNFIAKLILGLSSDDINGTPKILKTSLVEKLRLQSENIALDIELLYKLKKRGALIKEFPAKSKKRGGGASTTNIKSVIEMFLNIIKLRLHRLK